MGVVVGVVEVGAVVEVGFPLGADAGNETLCAPPTQRRRFTAVLLIVRVQMSETVASSIEY